MLSGDSGDKLGWLLVSKMGLCQVAFASQWAAISFGKKAASPMVND